MHPLQACSCTFQLELSLSKSSEAIEQQRNERALIEQQRKAEEEQKLSEIARQAEESKRLLETERALRERSEALAVELKQQAVCFTS